ncbi:hypothetical protein [Actinosynnema pretiosum]|uniref:Uncharacterized protein n=1 Tax=Actinosynnema pretiosum TaxID=42197 RepID=A0A290ZA36_9PSEU|nr:hypothetical protein [Actinosynnema pretiosum]ATE55901.1 hypothetical protein CNX65_23635 [Actinosynnema pretiosum]
MGVGLRVPVLVGAALTLLCGLCAALLLSGAGGLVLLGIYRGLWRRGGSVAVLGFPGCAAALSTAASRKRVTA